jgi:hypothetical protein
VKACAPTLFALLLIAPAAFGRIGDTSADFKNRYGDPVFESFDKEGHGIRIYRSARFKEIRVTFAEDKSRLEYYAPADGVTDKEALFKRLCEESGDDYSYITSEGQLKIGFGESEGELKFVSGDGATRSFHGRVEIKKKNNQDYALVHDHITILEIPLPPLAADAAGFRSGLHCTITVLNRFPDDLWAPTAWVGKREHLDDQDMRDDTHDQLQTLVRVESDEKRIYDRSFCSVHQVTMELRTVEVAFGMLMFPAAERYCQEHFPHYRDFGIGGCVMTKGDENKTIQIYVCPACVAACNEYKAAHPAPPDTD